MEVPFSVVLAREPWKKSFTGVQLSEQFRARVLTQGQFVLRQFAGGEVNTPLLPSSILEFETRSKLRQALLCTQIWAEELERKFASGILRPRLQGGLFGGRVVHCLLLYRRNVLLHH